MTLDRGQEALVIFEELVALGPEERAARLEALSSRDPELCAEVQALLAVDEKADLLLSPFEGLISHPGLGALTRPRTAGFNGETEDLSGRTVSRYRVVERLAAGGMGILYLAEDPDLARPVVLKFLTAHRAHQPAVKERFLREARAAAALDHPNVCTIYEVGETEAEGPFIAMAFYEGETVRKMIERGPLPERDALNLTTQIARGLQAAHAHGIVHRDIKPENLLVTEGGVLKILDFGIAKTGDVTLTSPGVRLGTVGYLSPEQTRGDGVDHRTDLWSLGVVLYEMLTGRRPFRGKNDRAVISAIRDGKPTPPSQSRKDLSPHTQRIVRCLLSNEPQARESGAQGLLDGGSEPRAAGDGRRRRSHVRTAFAAFAAFAAVVLTGVAIGVLNGVSPAEPQEPRMRRLAVLPLSNLTGSPEKEYFVAGMHDALITELGRISALTVISRQSVLRYQGSSSSVPVIARELAVDGLVEGSVFQAGDSVRVNVQLIRAEPEEHLWAGAYFGTVQEALALQSEAARGLSRAVDALVGSEEEEEEEVPLASHSVDLEAQEAYLQGLYLVQKHTTTLGLEVGAETLLTSIGYLEEAVAIDAEWAAAHAKLAWAYHWLASSFLGIYEDEFYPKSKAAALRALALDEAEAQAHASLGYVLFKTERDWVGAEREIRRALELEPGAHHWIYALYLRSGGRYDEAITEFRKAEERDPLSDVLSTQLAFTYGCAGRHEEAIAQLERLRARLGGTGPGLERRFGLHYSAMGQHEAAIAEMVAAVVKSDSAPTTVALLATVYARAGQEDEARRLLNQIERHLEDDMAPGLYAALGLNGRAVVILRAQMEKYPNEIGGIKCTEVYRALRDEPEIREVVQRFGYVS